MALENTTIFNKKVYITTISREFITIEYLFTFYFPLIIPSYLDIIQYFHDLTNIPKDNLQIIIHDKNHNKQMLNEYNVNEMKHAEYLEIKNI